MADIPDGPGRRYPALTDGAGTGPSGWLNRLAASRRFQSFAARIPGLRHVARAEGRALFDLISGFVQSQLLAALVELRLLHSLAGGPLSAESLARRHALTADRMALLLQGGAAIGLLRRCRDGRFALAARGAAVLGVPGLESMIRHHHVLYRDLADPVAFLRGETDPGLARFWPYVFGAAGAADPDVAATYSRLMTESQVLVAEDTLGLFDFGQVRHLMDVGGGSGAFLAAVGRRHAAPELTLFDLPAVVAGSPAAFAEAGLGRRVTVVPGSFRDDPLPQGTDAISLVRVLYDHSDSTVAALLTKVFNALPPGGQIVISEPMSGGDRPDRATDTYFAVYTAAMRTGRTRSAAEIGAMLGAAGFADVSLRPGFRSFVTSVVAARRAG